MNTEHFGAVYSLNDRAWRELVDAKLVLNCLFLLAGPAVLGYKLGTWVFDLGTMAGVGLFLAYDVVWSFKYARHPQPLVLHMLVQSIATLVIAFCTWLL